MSRLLTERKAKQIERYELERSPLAQKPTQKELASLVGHTKSELRALGRTKSIYIVRRQTISGKKTRELVYPKGKLRRVHEILKYHLNKVKQPSYIYSPRKGRAQRDNALAHVGQRQYLLLDIKQFYPSTTREHVFRWCRYVLGMYDDVAGLFTEIATVDGKVSFGSPLTPVLTTLIHRRMFDSIHEECRRRGLRMTIWVDDIVISGKFVPSQLLISIRGIVRKCGLRSHKIAYKTGSRVVLITGVPVVGTRLDAPRSVHEKIRTSYSALRSTSTSASYHKHTNDLLSALGSYRYYVGRNSTLGAKAAARMEGLRRRRSGVDFEALTPREAIELHHAGSATDEDDVF